MMQNRSARSTVVAATVAFAVFAAWLLLGWGGVTGTTIASSVASVSSSLFALWCAVIAGRTGQGRQRVAWQCFSLGLAGWVVGNLIWSYYLVVLGTWPPFPSAADACYLVLPLSACAAAIFAPAQGVRAGVRLLLDAIIVVASVFMVAWSAGLEGLFDDGPTRGLGAVLMVAYPFGDVAMVTISAVLLLAARPGRRLSPALLLAAMICIGLCDVVYGYVVADPEAARSTIVAGWALSGYLIGLAALASRPAPLVDEDGPRRPPSGLQTWLPYLPVPFAIAVGAVSLWPHPGTGPVIVTGLALILATLLRQLTLLTENRTLLDTVADMALRDPLTGLANRTLFGDRLAHAMAMRERTGAPVAVLLADLDDFKLVNDTMGHPVGDQLLRSVGERLQDVIRPGDTVARLGGDEFAILVEDTPAIADHLAERVIRTFDQPFTMAGRTVYMTLSIGVAAAAGAVDVTGDELFKRADLAMYSAKRAHVSVRSFTPDMREDATEMNLPSQRQKTGRGGGVARIQFLGDLRRAIEERELDLVYQPKISLTTGEAAGVEALIRWPHPEYGLLAPADFLPLVKENGLMESVTDFVLERAVEDAASWCRSVGPLPVAINLSAPSLDDDSLPARILSVLDQHGMSPSTLTLEITEDLLLASVGRARSVLDELRRTGIRVAIDDFGSGYGAMTYLHELPIDELKLDRQFIAPIQHDGRATAIVRSVIELANEFGLTSVAEGVEDKATADLLRSYGCGFAQGHYFSMPVPAQAIALGIGVSSPGRPASITATATTPPSWA